MGLILLAALLAQDAPKKEFKLGVVNLKQCFDPKNYDRIKDVDAELKKVLESLTASIVEVQKKIDRLKGEIDGLRPDMQLYWDKVGQMKLAETELDFKRKFGRQQYLNRYNDLQITVYNEIRRVVGIYGKEKRFDLILRVEEPALESEETPNAAAQIQSRVVLHYADGVDVTNAVITILNEEHAKQKAVKRP